MHELSYEKIIISAADLGYENPLLPLHSSRDIYADKKRFEIPSIPVDDALRAKVHQAYPVPEVIDFRMSSDVPMTSKD